jgi:hypothetical protein
MTTIADAAGDLRPRHIRQPLSRLTRASSAEDLRHAWQALQIYLILINYC